MNAYVEMQNRHQEMVNNLPIHYAFGKEQFREMMLKKFHLAPSKKSNLDKIYALFGGGYALKSDKKLIDDTFYLIEHEKEKMVEEDSDGTHFVYDMFSYELGNHECAYTGDPMSAIYACGYSLDDINNNQKLLRGFSKAWEDAQEWHRKHYN